MRIKQIIDNLPPDRRTQLGEVVRFGIVGVTATLLQYGIYWLLIQLMSDYLLQMLTLNLFLWLGVPKALAPIPMFCICVPVNFLLVRFFLKR